MIKIIAVDDEPAFGEMLSIYMEDFGDFDITIYTSPEEAIEKIIAGEADAVITDYLMEEMDGITLIKTVKSLVPDIPFVLLTGLDDREVILNAMNAGADFIQFKSEEPSRLFTEIAQKITSAVEKYRARKETDEGNKTRELLMRAQRDLMGKLSSASTSNQALDATLTTIRFLTGCTTGSIHLIHEKTNKIELAISHNLPNELIKKFNFGEIHQVVYAKKPRYFPAEKEQTLDLQKITGGQIPIMAGNEVTGVISFILDHPKSIQDELRDTIELLAGHLGNALVRINSEEQVRHREMELSELYKVMQELVIVIDMDGTILNVNPATTRILAYSEQELIGMPIQILYAPAIRDEIIFQFMDLTGTGGSIQNTYPFLDRNGVEVPVETRGTIGIWGGRHVLFCISRDIKERLEAERSLHEYYEKISAILTSSTAQIYMKDNNLKYLMGNEPFLSFVHSDSKTLPGKSDGDFFSGQIAHLREKTDEVVLTRNIPLYNIEEEIPGDEGMNQWFVSSKVPIHDQSGSVTGLVGTSLNITDLVRTRQELERRDRILSAVSAVAQTLVRNNEWEPIIPECLELLGQAAGVEQAILMDINLFNRVGFEEYYSDWVSEGDESDRGQSGIFTEMLPSLYTYLERNRFYLGNRKAISEEIGPLKHCRIPEFLLLLPIYSSDTLWGTLAFMTWNREHICPIAEIEALIMASEIIGSAISRYQTEELFHKPVERSLVGVYLIQDDRFVYTNPRMSEIFGCNREELEGSSFIPYIHPEEVDRVLDHHQRIIDNPDATDDYEFRGITADGRGIRIENLISGILYKGKPAVIGSIMDITVRKEAEDGIRLSLKEKDILLREVHHRVKNNMQIIVSMLRIQSNMVDNPIVFDVLQESKNRILSMAMVHEKLYRTDNLVSINLLEYLSSLATTLISDFSPDESLITLDLICDPAIEMTIDAGIPLGLIMNELITNSFKHGFIPQKQGTIGISIVTDEQGFLNITYRDNGKGLPPGFDMEKSDTLGMQIISNLIFQSSGEISFRTENGAVMQMKIPMKEGFIKGGEGDATGE